MHRNSRAWSRKLAGVATAVVLGGSALVTIAPAAQAVGNVVTGTAFPANAPLNPLPGGTVEIWACSSPGGAVVAPYDCLGSEVTAPVDATGNFSTPSLLPSGGWNLVPVLVGSEPYPGAAPTPIGEPYQVDTSAGNWDGHLFALTAGAVSGKVARADASTLPAGTLEVVACPGAGSWSASCADFGGITAPVDASGDYALALADGDWDIAPVTVQHLSLGVVPVTVTVFGDLQPQDFNVAAATISGTVLHPSNSSPYPAGHAAVVACPTSIPFPESASCAFPQVDGVKVVVNALGDYEFVVPPGTWYVGAYADANDVSGGEIGGGVGSGPGAGPFVLGDGGSRSQPLTISSARVSGTVTDAASSVGISATVTFCHVVGGNSCQIRNAMTAPDGTYAILMPPTPDTWIPSARGPGGAQATHPTITIVDAADQSAVDLAIGGGSISGEVQDASGAVIATSTYLTWCSSGLCQSLPITPTFTITNVTPGTYELFAHLAGGGLARLFPPAPVSVAEGLPANGLVVRAGGGSIAATVTAAAGGAPVGGVTISPCLEGVTNAPGGRFCFGGPPLSSSPTNGSGVTTLTGLPTGSYSLVASLPSFPPPALAAQYVGNVTVSDPGSTPVTVSMGAPSTVSGTVRDAANNPPTQAIVVACPGAQDPPATFTFSISTMCAGAKASNPTFTGSYSVTGLGIGPYRLRAYGLVGGNILSSGVEPRTLGAGSTTTVDLVVGAAPPSNTVTIPSSGGGVGGVTITSPSGTTVTGATAAAVPASPAPPAGAQFPGGLLGFTVNGVGSGGSADVTITLPAGSNPNGYFKLRGNAWVDFSSHVTIVGDTITLHLVDGDAFDSDPADGIIGDPGMPARGYKFSGFRPPINPAPTVNSAKAGQAVPVTWRITQVDGTPVSDPASFVSLTSTGEACGGGSSDAVEVYATGTSGLRYLGNGEWQINWKTEKAWAGHCRQLKLQLADGFASRTAEFKFK